jgi:putative tricarboxylic transport membrane protein
MSAPNTDLNSDVKPAGPSTAAAPVSVRGPEVAVALFLMLLSVLVITDSQRVGTGWAEDGPRSGYFPFFMGLGLLLSSGWVLLSQLRNWARTAEAFADHAQLGSVWAVFWPMTVYVALITQLGIYLPSALLIAFFMLRHGKHHKGLTAAIALGVPLLFFAVFEKWFLVPLPKGPLEAALGL